MPTRPVFLLIAILYSLLWIGAAVKFGDRQWEKYYPTMLFAAFGEVMYEFLCYRYPLWRMEPNGLPAATIPILLLTLIGMPVSTWIYLSQYPSRSQFYVKVLYVLMFIALFTILEYLSVRFGAITYHNGWNLLCSIGFVLVMFVTLRIHYTHPKRALILSGVFTAFLVFAFHLTLDKVK